MGVPKIKFTNSTDKISTKINCKVVFSVDEDFITFEARATTVKQEPGRGVGTLVNSMNSTLPNYFPADTDYAFVIADTNLTQGDGLYTISLYAESKDGIWSDVVAFEWDGTSANGWDSGIWV